MIYKIQKIKETSKKFNGIAGMIVLTFTITTDNTTFIDGPVDIHDYDNYYEWIRKECNKLNLSSSDNLESFKEEFLDTDCEFIPPIDEETDLQQIRIASKDDIICYNEIFNNYFKRYIER